MELNYSLKLAENVLKDIEPVTCNYVKGVITSRSGVDDKKSVLAITRLLELMGGLQKNAVKKRIRSIEARHCEVLKKMALLWRDTGKTCFHRSEFLENVNQNDFSIMKYWGLIAPCGECGKGCWRITKEGIGFTFSIPGYRYVSRSFMQMGGTKGNYEEIKSSDPVTYSDISGDYVAPSSAVKYRFEALPEES